MKGQLSDYPLAELLREIAAARGSGALRLARQRVQAVIYFDAGEVIYARTNLRLHRLAECLRRWGAVAEEQLARHLTESMTDEEAAGMLVASGVLREEELPALLARQSEDALMPMLLWTDGAWHFDARARLERGAGAPVNIRPLLLESARRLPSEFAASRMGNDDELISPAQDAPTADAPAGLQLLPVEAFILSRVDAPLPVGHLVAIGGVSEPEARRAVYVLSLGGLLRRERWARALSPEVTAQSQKAFAPSSPLSGVAAQAHADESSVTKTKEPKQADAASEPGETVEADPREEMKLLFRHAEAETFYGVLGVTRGASPADIKNAYYTLARRLHPDRFRRHADEALRTRIDHAFAKIAQAYDTLKDSKQRANYDLKMDKLSKDAAPADRPAGQREGGEASGQTAQYRAEDSFQQGLSAMRQGNRMLAVMHFGEAARLFPKTARYRANFGHALAGDAATRRQAEAELKAAIALDSENVSYRLMLAEIYRDLGLRLRAEGELQRALAINPQHADARRLLDALQKSQQGA